MVMLTGAGATTFREKRLDASPSGVLTTTRASVLGVETNPLADSWVDETNVVASAAPSSDTTDPFINPPPFTAIVNEPVSNGDGVTEEIDGIGMIVTDELPL